MKNYLIKDICGRCETEFLSDPACVPIIDTRAICRECVRALNLEKKRMGVPLIFVKEEVTYEQA